MAGNVGTPLARWPARSPADATVVCECSSFQLEDSEAFAPECAVLLNLAPDHLDRHGDLDDYLAAKLRIFANQGNDDVAVYNATSRAARGTSAAARGGSRLCRGATRTARCRSARASSSTVTSR